MKTNSIGSLRTSWGVLLLLALSALIGGCGESRAPEQLVFADPNNPIAALIYIAEAKGYFKDENLTLTYEKVASGRESLNSIEAGKADIALGSEFTYASDLLRGKPLRILCTVQRTNFASAIVARRDKGIATAADLRGKKVGLAPNTNSDYLLSVIAREAGVADEELTRVPVVPAEIANALEKGDVDAVATWQPNVSNAQARFAQDDVVLLRTAAYTELAVLGARPRTIVDKREALLRLIRALVRAEDFVASHGVEALEIVATRQAPKPADSMREDWPHRIFQVRLDNLMLTSIENEGTWLARRDPSPPQIPDYRAALVPEFLEAVRPELVTLTKGSGS